MKLLHLDSGLFESQSITRKLGAQIVQRLRNDHAGLDVTYRDLAASAPGHLSADALIAMGQPADQQTPAQQAEAAVTEELLAEFLAADILVIAAPMYNFSIPSQLKAWFDRILQAGKTFRYTAEGPVGLAGGKQVYVVSARGGVYSTHLSAMDFQEDYLRTLLGFVGITDISIIRAEGLAIGEEARNQALAGAEGAIRELNRVAA